MFTVVAKRRFGPQVRMEEIQTFVARCRARFGDKVQKDVMEAALRDRLGRLTADVDDIPEDDDCVAGHTAAPREITMRGRRARECMTPSPAWTLTDWPRYGPTAEPTPNGTTFGDPVAGPGIWPDPA
ncbi:hypothetical protein [Dactylosporangium darangshiense]|uniref:DivIVA domain-containing protein n=1 Tax=Dactylosporangium darangshiense TaxID=579108 RepID=A0ABP8DB34_9ACTN